MQAVLWDRLVATGLPLYLAHGWWRVQEWSSLQGRGMLGTHVPMPSPALRPQYLEVGRVLLQVGFDTAAQLQHPTPLGLQSSLEGLWRAEERGSERVQERRDGAEGCFPLQR